MRVCTPVRIIILILYFLAARGFLHVVAAQETSLSAAVELAHEYVGERLRDWNLTIADVAGMTVSDAYTDASTGITRVYFQQRYMDIPVYNAILNVSINSKGKVFFSRSQFVSHLADKINTMDSSWDSEDAVNQLMNHLELPHAELMVKSRSNDNIILFEKGTIAKEDIIVELCYEPVENEVRLSWDILFAPSANDDKWSARIDATTGETLTLNNWTLYCNQERIAGAIGHSDCEDEIQSTINTEISASGAHYNVWPAPYQSPDHGPRTIVVDPHDPLASPYGWHDVNGQPGADFTITRGNNAYVYQDRDDLGYSSGDEPNGGSDLHFDFPYDPSWEPVQFQQASSVNLFYWMNYMHDFSYHFGFDEAAGNFQKNNYGRGGLENDFLYGITQNGANTGANNNARYSHGDDGKPSAIRMMEFVTRVKYLTVNEPRAIAGKYLTSLPSSGWGDGAYVTSTPVTGEVVLVDDGIEEPSRYDGCETIINAAELQGKIAMLDRGGCSFAQKALKVQDAGAIAVIVCNYDDQDYHMNPGPDGVNLHIPIVMIPLSSSNSLREFAGQGLKVTLVNPGLEGPQRLDSGLDNGIIAHEFGHGISCRIAGGPDRMCLTNAEQMGEGWADFFALAVTVRPGDTGEIPRGFATYVSIEAPGEKGIRRYPYSTDMNINPLTYGLVAASQEVHDVGEVWASMLWDMYWSFVDLYGWSADPYLESSGNHKAIRLVFDGLKNLPCNPGFVDGRDAIIAADEALYNGEHFCLLWEVFARRGLGYSADQGSSFDAGDQKEAFDLHPLCTNKLHIEKAVTELINAGDDIEVTIRVANFKRDNVTNVVVTDEIPEGTTLKSQSASHPFTLEGSGIAFEIGNLQTGEEVVINYSLSSAPEAWSQRMFIDEVTDENNINWLSYTTGSDASNVWAITDEFPGHTGNYAWFSPEIPGRSRQVLELDPNAYTFYVEGNKPALRFYHRYLTDAGINGGVVDVKEKSAVNWSPMDQHMIRNGYRGYLDYHTFISPGIQGFSGNSGEHYKATYVDLSDWMGQKIQVRFRFGTYDNVHEGIGWLIDDVEFMDILSYNGEACVTSDQGDYECTFAPEGGTIVNTQSDPISGLNELPGLNATVYPNPASDLLNIVLSDTAEEDAYVSIHTLDGRIVHEQLYPFSKNHLSLNTSEYPPGMYLVRIRAAQGSYAEKVVFQE